MNDRPSIEELRHLFELDPEAGLLRWRASPGAQVRAGDIAGSKNQQGYIRVGLRRKQYKVHQIIFALHNGRWPEMSIDHKNRIKTKNQPSNLREADARTQLRNRVLPNTLGLMGVRRLKTGRFEARLTYSGHRWSLGHFTSDKDAARAYDAAVLEHCGPDFPTNASLGLL
jgi:hypothetical protein